MVKKVDRAAQFLPFDALKGLQEELRAREEKLSRVEKKELSEDMAEELSIKLSRIKIGAEIDLTFYHNGHYLDLKGIVKNIDKIYRYILIGQEKIYFDNIYKIR